MMTLVAKRAVRKEAERAVPKVVLRGVIKVAKEEAHAMYLRKRQKSSPLLRLIK